MCIVENCQNASTARNMCHTHYTTWRRNNFEQIEPTAWRKEPAERFWIKVNKAGAEECWPWVGGFDAYGYGSFNDGQKTVKSHRFAYEQLIGNLSAGLSLDHLCRNRACVNPHHMEQVTRGENVLRSPINITAINARKTHCNNGHSLSDAYVDKTKGWRKCRQCHSERRRKQRK